jgi:hypothetical protein
MLVLRTPQNPNACRGRSASAFFRASKPLITPRIYLRRISDGFKIRLTNGIDGWLGLVPHYVPLPLKRNHA